MNARSAPTNGTANGQVHPASHPPSVSGALRVPGDTPSGSRSDVPAEPGTLTRALNGEASPGGAVLFERVYEELRAIAARLLRREAGRPLETTVLVHEAWIKLAGCRWESRGHYFATAARAMRQVLVDDARRRRVRRARAGVRTPTTVCAPGGLDPLEVLALDEALGALERFDPRAAAVVGLKYFAGLGCAQVAEALDMKLRTVERDWAYARAWLLDRIEGKAEGARPSGEACNGVADGERP